MAFTTSCCLNLPPPTSSSSSFSSSSSSKTTQLSWQRNDKWRSECVLGLACAVIGVELCNLACCCDIAIAKEMMSDPLPLLQPSSKERVLRWSDKRACPPWHFNSLETIVPENLPRPSAHRRWEAVGSLTETAPPVKVIVKTTNNNKCFSM